MGPLGLEQAESYVAAAYLVFVALLLIYVAIMAGKLQRIQRALRDLAGLAESKGGGEARWSSTLRGARFAGSSENVNLFDFACFRPC